MATLNRHAAEAMVRHRVKAATDVTGFGLLGHLTRMMLESKATAEIEFDALPLFPDVLEYAKAGIYSGANERNASFSAKHTEFAEGITESEQAVLYDAQTSGGLLMAVPPPQTEALLKALHAGGGCHAAIIGRVTALSSRAVNVL
jgi:selenide,water dikinase